MIIRAATSDDGDAIAGIYAPYVDGTIVSFEEVAPGAAEMAGRIEAGGTLHPWLVAEEAGEIVGFASASAFRTRTAYRFAVETSVYLCQGAQGRGVGSALYRPLLALLEAQGFTQAIAAISLPNPASVKLHERFGFAPAGVYRQVGWKLGRWIDVGLWQRALAAPSYPPQEPRPISGDKPEATS